MTALDPLTEAEKVVRWRIEQLREAGYPHRLASRLGFDERVDLHKAVELVKRGCPPDLAARILKPL